MRALVLLSLSLLLISSPGCVFSGLSQRLLWETKHPYQAEVVGYRAPSDGPVEVDVLLEATDGSGVRRVETVEVAWWPEPQVDVAEFPSPKVEVGDWESPGPMCCLPIVLGIPLSIDFSPDSGRTLRAHDGTAWREVATLPALNEPPSLLRRGLYWVLFPLGVLADTALLPLELAVQVGFWLNF